MNSQSNFTNCDKTDLEGKQGEHHEAEHSQSHHLRQLLDRVEQGIDDGLEAGHDGDCLESSEHPEGSEARQVAHVYEGCQVSGTDHKKVQPIPRVSQISVIVQNESFSEHFDYHLRCVDPEKNIPEKRE